MTVWLFFVCFSLESPPPSSSLSLSLSSRPSSSYLFDILCLLWFNNVHSNKKKHTHNTLELWDAVLQKRLAWVLVVGVMGRGVEKRLAWALFVLFVFKIVCMLLVNRVNFVFGSLRFEFYPPPPQVHFTLFIYFTNNLCPPPPQFAD